MNPDSCKRAWLLPLVLCLASIGVAQPLGLPVCDGLNHLSLNANPFTVQPNDTLAVQYVPTQSLVLNGIEFFTIGTAIGITSGGDFSIVLDDPTTGLPSTNVIADGHAPPGFISGTWNGAFLNQPVYLRANVPYWLVYTNLGAIGPEVLGSEDTPPGPHTVLSTQRIGGGPWTPISTANQIKVRVVSASCTPPTTPAAQAVTVGTGCAGTGGLAPVLSTTVVPGIGEQNFAVAVSSLATSAPVTIFWGTTGSSVGVDVGNNCRLHLDPNQLLATLGAGLNPLFSGTINGSGLFVVNLPVPHATNLAGTQFWLQAAVLDPNGPLFGTQPMTISNALQLVIGY